MSERTEEPEEIVFETVVICGGGDSVENKEIPQIKKLKYNNIYNEELNSYYSTSSQSPQTKPLNFAANEIPNYDALANNSDSGDETDEAEVKGAKRRKRTKHRFAFNKKKTGVKEKFASKMASNKPYDFFQTFLDDKFIEKMVEATNQYAHMYRENNQTINTWIQPWRDTNVDEMKKFIGILIWMGLVKYPTMNSYWCRSQLYTNCVLNSLSRSQFQLLSHMWRLNLGDDKSLDLASPLVDELRQKFKQMVIPAETFTIEKTFIPSESETEGVNILFLIAKGGYIYDFQVSHGKRLKTINANDAMNFAKPLLDKGRTMWATEDLTSTTLAKRLMEKRTHFVGLINPNDSHIPFELKEKHLYGDETETCTTADNLTFRKYNHFFEQYLLSTRRSGTMTEFYRYRSITTVSYDLKVNNLVLMNSMNWYQKYLVEIVINTCLVNACHLYRQVCTKKISSVRFMEEVITGLLNLPATNLKTNPMTLGKLNTEEDRLAEEHTLVRLMTPKRCVGCYERISRESGRKIAMNKAPKTPHQCPTCNRSYCLECFFVFHKGRLRN